MTSADNIHSIGDAAFKRDHPQAYAQQSLIKTTIELAVDELYAHCEKEQFEVETTIADSRNLGPDKEAVVTAIMASRNQQGELDERSQTRAFNLLAKKNGFDLTLKTSGMKTPESIERKQKLGCHARITDAARMSVVSSDVDRLNRFADALNHRLRKLQNDKDKEWPEPNIEPWSMRANSLLSQILKTSIRGIGTEVQFLPREQARMAARITHYFYKVTRTYEDAINSLNKHTDPGRYIAELAQSNDGRKKAEAMMLIEKIEATSAALTAYNKIAKFINKLGSNEIMSTKDMDVANAILKNMDESNQALDEEGVDAYSTKEYSPIFKTLKDLKTYRAYIKTHGTAIGLFPLPEELTQDTPHKDIELAMMKLFRCNQLTHAGYMNSASEPMRNLWVKHAHETNKNLPPDKQIPAGVIATVSHTLTPTELGETHGRTL